MTPVTLKKTPRTRVVVAGERTLKVTLKKYRTRTHRTVSCTYTTWNCEELGLRGLERLEMELHLWNLCGAGLERLNESRNGWHL